jgi:hypothetical protein
MQNFKTLGDNLITYDDTFWGELNLLENQFSNNQVTFIGSSFPATIFH